MKQRNYSLDWIRVIAMFGVMFDHYICSFGSKILNNIGLQIGGVSVTMFFVISAFLFGIKWENDEHKAFSPIVFLRKRCTRIFIPLWLTLLLIVPIEYFLKDRFEISTILLNAIGLGWSRPFVFSGHLWYITMLIILYVCFFVISRVRLDSVGWKWWTVGFVFIIISYFVFQNKLSTYSKAGPPLFMYLSILMFARGGEVLEFVKKFKKSVLFLTVFVMFISQYVYQLGWHYSHKALAIGSFICAGFLLFLTLNAFLNATKQSRFIGWIAGISYEIYLVHAPLIAVSKHLTQNTFLWTLIWIIVSLLSAVILNKISNRIIHRI